MELAKDNWSERLLLIKPVIKNLYFSGNIDLLLDETRPRLAIVGSRKMTEYGRRVIEKWMPELVRAGVVVVSGFMYGVDQVAHNACLENDGDTIAVLGWGIDRKLVAEDEKLYRKFAQSNSLMVSEYAGDVQAELWMFPQRNRIVAGISDAVLVVEAAEKSGSLITADWAKKMNKKVLAVPGRVDVAVAGGVNKLIREGQARMVTSAVEVLTEMGMEIVAKKVKNMVGDPLLGWLENGGMSVDELAKLAHISIAELGQKLTVLTLMGEVYESEGKYYKI